MRHPALLLALSSITACTGTIDMDDQPLPPPTDVQVTVRDGQSPQAGVLVVFQRADGTATEVTTDARGVAAAEVPDGASVTVVRTYPVAPGETPIPDEVYTYVGVKAGDRLALGKPATEKGSPAAVLVSVPQLATGTVKITTPCGAGQGTGPLVAITVRDCDPSIGLYVIDGAGQSFFKRAPYAGTIDVSHEALTDSLASTISAQNVPPNTTVNVEQRLGADGFYFFTTGPKRVDQAPANVDIPALTGVDVLLLTSSSSNNRTQVVASRRAYSQEILSVDASAGLTASVSALAYKRDTGLSWTEEGPGTLDAVLAELNVTRPDTSTLTRQYTHLVLAPHAGASLQVPVLSGSAAIYNPAKDDQVGAALGVVAATGGYDALRARAFAVPSIVDAAPLDGQITLSYSGQRPGL